MKNYKTIIAIFVFAATLLSAASCTNDYFNQERYEEIIESTFPVSNVDKYHDWNLMQSMYVSADLTASGSDPYCVDVFDKNPKTGGATKVASGTISGKGVFKFTMPIDKVPTQLYAIAYNQNECVVDGMMPVTSNSITVKSVAGKLYSLPSYPNISNAEYTYLFEETFPQCGDFDFNDVVMGVSMEKNPKAINGVANYLDVTIRLRAVGASQPIAACMHFNGITADDVEPEFSMPQKEWDFYRYAIDFLVDPEGKLQEARGGDVRIDLFNDAHFAMSGGALDETGTMVPRVYMNTKTDTIAKDWITMSEKVSTYRITFTNEGAYNDFTFADLDIFVISSYNASYYEIHTSPFFGKRVVKDYPATIYGYPWALVVPDGNFKYPVEGVPIGRYSTDLSYYEGAYQRGQYSFGAWARNHSNKDAQVWYHYPAKNLVYE